MGPGATPQDTYNRTQKAAAEKKLVLDTVYHQNFAHFPSFDLLFTAAKLYHQVAALLLEYIKGTVHKAYVYRISNRNHIQFALGNNRKVMPPHAQ